MEENENETVKVITGIISLILLGYGIYLMLF